MAKNRYKPWTPDEEERLLRMRSVGEPLEVIALALKRTAIAVDRRFYTVKNRGKPVEKIEARSPH